jgi:GNAT superfamily N-acetyltransferase
MSAPFPTLRRARPDDAAPLAELAARIFTDTFAEDTPPDDLAEFLAKAYGVRQQSEEISNPDVITIVAEAPEGLAAYAQVRRRGKTPKCVTAEEPVELWRFYVQRDWHGGGLAHRLMAAVMDAARELGGRHLWLSVWERNVRAIAFYGKHGFHDSAPKTSGSARTARRTASWWRKFEPSGVDLEISGKLPELSGVNREPSSEPPEPSGVHLELPASCRNLPA